MKQTAERKGMENLLRSMWNHWQRMEIETLRSQQSGLIVRCGLKAYLFIE